jgi:hypothetical protein
MADTPRKPTIMIDVTTHEWARGAIIGVTLTVDYIGGTARVSIQEFPPLSDAEFQRAVREKLVQLADALREAEQSPQGIFWHHRERR